MSSSSKRQTTMAKRAREQAVKERRERKAEKKAAARLAKAEGTTLSADPFEDDTTDAVEDDTPVDETEPAV